MSSKKIVVMAEFSIIPLGSEKTSVSRYVAQAIKAMKNVKGIRYEISPMGTILEAENLEIILKAVNSAHKAMVKAGSKRIVSTLRIDDRRDKPRTMESKVRSVKKQI